MNDFVYAQVTNPKLENKRIAILRIPGTSQDTCVTCEAELTYDDDSSKINETVVQVACSHQCAKAAGWHKPTIILVAPTALETETPDTKVVSAGQVVKPEKVIKLKRTCPECGGFATRGRSNFAHTETCQFKATQAANKTIIVKPKRTCPECGGFATRGRSNFAHTENCQTKLKSKASVIKPKRVCPSCGGLGKQGRNSFAHADGCLLNVKAIKAAKPKRTCPDCGGFATRGRNAFAHAESCPKAK